MATKQGLSQKALTKKQTKLLPYAGLEQAATDILLTVMDGQRQPQMATDSLRFALGCDSSCLAGPFRWEAGWQLKISCELIYL